jgi:hypothetical protein
MKPNECLFAPAAADMQAHFVDIAGELGIAGDLTMVSRGPFSWVAIDDDGGAREADVALKLTPTSDPEAALDESHKRIGLLRELRSHGAQIVDYLEEPRIVYDPKRMGGYILTVSRYLPVKGATPFEHGQAVASLHNASLHVDTTDCEEINILEQLASSAHAAEYLEEFRKHGKPFQLGTVEMSPAQIEAYTQYLDEAERLRRDLFVASKQKGLPEVIVQEDVHDQNIMRDTHGTPIAIDVEGYVGPSAIDFGRPLTDWHQRFGHPMQYTHDYIAGYDTHVDPRLKPDEELRHMVSDYTNIRSSLVFISIAVSRAMERRTKEEWLLSQGLYRLSVINDRNIRWNALDDARKAALREQQSDG